MVGIFSFYFTLFTFFMLSFDFNVHRKVYTVKYHNSNASYFKMKSKWKGWNLNMKKKIEILK